MAQPTDPQNPEDSPSMARKRRSKYRRARVRNFLFTVGPNKLSGGRVGRRHLAGEVELRELDVFSPLWPESLDGLRIAHVSDFHLGELLRLDDALQVVELIRAQQPDFVACTGDVVDLHLTDETGVLLQEMAGIGAPLGTALVLGNHDELHCGETLAGMAIEVGLLVLRNEAAKIMWNGFPLIVAGTRWAKSAQACSRTVNATCGEQTHLLLSHNPKSFPQAARLHVPLTLSGHTHGGQIAMKNRPGANLAMTHRYSAGLFRQGPSRLYVTSGVGAWFPLRVNCPAEVAMITMRREAVDAGEDESTDRNGRPERASSQETSG